MLKTLQSIKIFLYIRSPAMWKLQDLQFAEVPSKAPGSTVQVHINGNWVPARPENFKPKYCSLWKRLGYAWQVVIGRSETFVWPEGQ
jgi:hypothetical protein